MHSVAKTLVDCLKYRKRIRANLALHVLDQCIVQRKCSLERIRHFGRICRVGKLIRSPYASAGQPVRIRPSLAKSKEFLNVSFEHDLEPMLRPLNRQIADEPRMIPVVPRVQP